MKRLIVSLLAVAAPAFSGAQTFTGTISESECPNADHSHMRMGPTDAECAVACVDLHGAAYVLYDGTNVYTLSDQKAPEKLAGKKVTVTGTLNISTRTIQVDSITAAK